MGFEVFPGKRAGVPVVYLNTFAHEGEKVLNILREGGAPDFSLVAMSDLEWDRDMAPWDIPAVFENDTPCTGGADDFLKVIVEQIMPEAESKLPGPPSWRGIAGYSLAGLFAVYSVYRTDVFSRVASVSGSLWFPRFKEFVFEKRMLIKPDCMYFSLGDAEAKTRNEILKTVQENTEEIGAFYKMQGIDAYFHLNPGNHFRDAEKRTAAGIKWILER